LPDIEESLTHRFVENDDDANLIATVESQVPKNFPDNDTTGGMEVGQASTKVHDWMEGEAIDKLISVVRLAIDTIIKWNTLLSEFEGFAKAAESLTQLLISTAVRKFRIVGEHVEIPYPRILNK
jgi:hypothetical protein